MTDEKRHADLFPTTLVISLVVHALCALLLLLRPETVIEIRKPVMVRLVSPQSGPTRQLRRRREQRTGSGPAKDDGPKREGEKSDDSGGLAGLFRRFTGGGKNTEKGSDFVGGDSQRPNKTGSVDGGDGDTGQSNTGAPQAGKARERGDGKDRSGPGKIGGGPSQTPDKGSAKKKQTDGARWISGAERKRIGGSAPVYKREWQRRGISGTVVIRIEVDDTGDVVKATFVRRSAHKELDRSAMNAVKAFRFQKMSLPTGKRSVGIIKIPFG